MLQPAAVIPAHGRVAPPSRLVWRQLLLLPRLLQPGFPSLPAAVRARLHAAATSSAALPDIWKWSIGAVTAHCRRCTVAVNAPAMLQAGHARSVSSPLPLRLLLLR